MNIQSQCTLHTFVNFDEFSDKTKHEQFKKTVRSRAAKYGHATDHNCQIFTGGAWKRKGGSHRRRRKKGSTLIPLYFINSINKNSDHNTGTTAPCDALIADDTLMSPSSATSMRSQSFSLASQQVGAWLSNGGWIGGPYFSQTTLAHPSAPLLIHHYLTNIAVAIPELDLSESHLLRKQWFPMALANPAMLQTILLFSASHYISSSSAFLTTTLKCSNSLSTCNNSFLLQVKAHALRQIQNLLHHVDPLVTSSDTSIAAVAKMASYEAMFGDTRTYKMHMSGLLQLLSFRQSISKKWILTHHDNTLRVKSYQTLSSCQNSVVSENSKMEDPISLNGLDGLLQRMITWIDCNAAFITRQALCLPPDVRGSAPLPTPNPAKFLGQS